MSSVAQRIEWVDTAKALASCLVVFYHVTVSAGTALLPNGSPAVQEFWSLFSQALVPVRMPLFFLVSGILARNAIQRDWLAVGRNRIVNLLWPYLLWSIVFSLIAGLRYTPEDPAAYTRQSLATIPQGGNAYWFLSVLVLFFVVAKLGRRFLPYLLAVATVLFGLEPLVTPFLADVLHVPAPLATNLGRVAHYAVWYLLGIMLSRLVRQIEAALTPGLTALFAALYLSLAYAHFFHGAAAEIEAALHHVLAVLGVAALIGASVHVSGFAPVRRLSRFIAARTLPVYVLHPVLIVLVVVLTRQVAARTEMVVPSVLQLFWFPVLTAMIVAASLGIREAATTLHLDWLFVAPARSSPRRSDARVSG
jgi:uncharacterized membrane protein YcfT